ncbi:hypothetical protein G7Y89_g6028 [Cudoniella acicularis]|uniref:Peptidase M3A/M3B catalytic domain-containing protein n=1 Tax=Cudoniella acicularis TaxID=354080 RepID=A0A8H4RL93_9HELO|nr:hypothetical protein G7Y89_g6028 [Cudoniella acicularis]
MLQMLMHRIAFEGVSHVMGTSMRKVVQFDPCAFLRITPGRRAPPRRSMPLRIYASTPPRLHASTRKINKSIYIPTRVDVFHAPSNCLSSYTHSVGKTMSTTVIDENNLSMSQDGLRDLSAKERKRIQNRVAQRNYRRNQKERVRALEKAAGQRSERQKPSIVNDTSVFVDNNSSICDQIWNIPIDDSLSNFSLPQIDILEETLAPVWEEKSPEPKSPSNLGRTALHRAVSAGNESVCRLLLERGADFRKQDNNGQTPLHLAVETGSEGLIKLLLKEGNPNVKDSLGRTALFQALRSKNEKVTKLLLESQIDVNSKDILGEVALYVAVERSIEEIKRVGPHGGALDIPENFSSSHNHTQLRIGIYTSFALSIPRPEKLRDSLYSCFALGFASFVAPGTLKKPPQAAPLFTASPSSILYDAKRLIEQSLKVQHQIIESVQPATATFANTLLPLVQDENNRKKEAHVLQFYQNVSSDEELRASSSKMESLLNDFSIETAMREDLYKLIKAVVEKNENLDPESKQLLEKEHKNYIRNGLGLPAGPKRQRFKEIKKRLGQISIEFQTNLNEEKGGIWFLQKELEGVPEDVLSGFERGQLGKTGQLRLTFKGPDVAPVLNYATNSETRRQLLIANANKCNQNVPLLKEAIVLRDEAARLLGYPNHAAFRLEEKMIKSPETVNSFLADLRSKLTAGGLNEIEKLKQLKKVDVELMLEKDFSFDQQKVAEYFPLNTTIQHMLETFEKLFGMVFVEITGKDRDDIAETGKGSDIVWHPDVEVYSAWNEKSDEFLGYLYLDLHPRQGKFGHAANFNLQPGFVNADGQRSYPATALVCNFSKPTAKKPSLLKHNEVWMLFHELGHGIHDLVAKTRYARYHGTMTVQDFCEAPSQMLENWCWTPLPLKALSQHYSTLSPEYFHAWREGECDKDPKIGKIPEKIPDVMIKNLIRTKQVNNAIFYLRQLHVGIFDMTIHQPNSHEAAVKMNVSEMWNTLRKDIMKIEGPESQGQGNEWGHGEATFPHLLGDYDAGYYGYLCSQVYSLDIFHTVFRSDPMNAAEGHRYRRMILEKGGAEDEMKILSEFLGRKPSTDAFYRELGLA